MIVTIFLPLLPHTELGSQGTLLVQQFWTGFDLDLCADVLNMFAKMTLMENRPATLGKFSRRDHCLSFSLPDQGREIQVSAGFKYFPPKQGSVLFDMIEDVEEKPIPTPL